MPRGLTVEVAAGTRQAVVTNYADIPFQQSRE